MVQRFGTNKTTEKRNMYSDKDIEDAMQPNKMPDGMTEEVEFVEALQLVASLLKNTDFDTASGRTKLGLELINLSCVDGNVVVNKSINVIIAMSSHITQLISLVSSIEGVNIKKYFEDYQSLMLDPLIEKPVIPYYEP